MSTYILMSNNQRYQRVKKVRAEASENTKSLDKREGTTQCSTSAMTIY